MAHDILIIDDEKDIRSLIADILGDEGYNCQQASNSDEALDKIKQRFPHLIILDIWMKESRLDGLELLRELKREHPNLPIIMISGHGTIETAVEAIKDGAFDFIEKPFKTQKLLIMVSNALESARLKEENKALQTKVKMNLTITGTSEAAQKLRQQIQKIGPTNSRVLIQGNPGTGKEIVARSLHLASARKKHPFIALNCAALHPDKFEEELFGIERNEKAGSVKVGLLERAHEGTLYLDEIGYMPLQTQNKIIRILHEQTFRRLGGNRDIQVNLRIISSTSQDLTKAIAAEKFREDLYYRLNVVPLTLPLLKDRKEDIPLLAQEFLESFQHEGAPRKIRLSQECLLFLQSLEWPGNIRQLKNIIEWLVIMMPDDHDGKITKEMLPPEIMMKTPLTSESTDKVEPANSAPIELLALPLKEAREEFEKSYLKNQIDRFGGNISKASEHIGMDRTALHRKLKGLGLH